MSTAPSSIVLAVTNAGLRSILSAQLGMAGEMPISTPDHCDPALSKRLRATALLIIEESLIGSAQTDWAETLRDQCWSGRIIIIVNKMPTGPPTDDEVTLVDRLDASRAILGVVRLWRSRDGDLLNPS